MAMSETEARHLLRRTGFGVSKKELAKILDKQETREEAVARIVDFNPTRFKPGGREFEDVQNKWIKYMVKAKRQLQEKLVLFWHDQFACNFSTVGDAKAMALQNRLFRQHCKGNFKDLVKAVNKDPAMMEMLDTVDNRAENPNENYSRELQELFTMGVFDVNGNPNYEQADIVQIARAFTGWRYDDKYEAFLDDDEHDSDSPKDIFANVGHFSGPQNISQNGTGEAEIDTVIDIIFQHRHQDPDSSMHNTVARYITKRLIEYFAHPDPSLSYIDTVISLSQFDTAFDLQRLLEQIFLHDDFYLSAGPYTTATKKSVKWPIDFVAGTMRMLDMKFKGRYQEIPDFSTARDRLADMGQIVFEPPSVFGWDLEEGWISSATLLARYAFVRDATSSRDQGRSSLQPGNLINLTLTNPGAIVDAVLDVLAIPDQLDSAGRNALIAYLTDNGAVTQLDLNDETTRNVKLHGLFALLLQSPFYQLH